VSDIAISSLTAVALPSVTAVASRTSICVKETASVTAGGAATYTWVSHNNSTLTVLSVTPFINTTYSVVATSAVGCVNSQSVTIKVSSCVGLEEKDLSEELIIFPNPSNEVFTLKSQLPLHIIIYDATGKELLSTHTEEGEHPISLDYPAGHYFLRASDGVRTARFVLIKH
jgi:hypothetical protein